MPDKIYPGDTVTVKLDLSMQDNATMLITASAYVRTGVPEDNGSYGLKYNVGTKFEATEKGAPYECGMDTCENNLIPTVTVYHVFSESGRPGEEMAIEFYGCDSSTYFIYRWVEK